MKKKNANRKLPFYYLSNNENIHVKHKIFYFIIISIIQKKNKIIMGKDGK